MIEVRQYVDRLGRNAFLKWYGRLDAAVQFRIAEAILRLEDGNVSALKGLGSGLLELRLNFGPGYRLYCGREGDSLVILLGGGTKSRQEDDTERARVLWQEHKVRKERQ